MKDYLREMNLEDKLAETDLLNSWEDIVGRQYPQDRQDYIKDHVLYVHLRSSVVRNELLWSGMHLGKK